ncbi:MAG: hypothetical protein HC802_04630 [Caldilineaceae bacterium]|nr:hypothetical protein [Caldilineaceae bacterium]
MRSPRHSRRLHPVQRRGNPASGSRISAQRVYYDPCPQVTDPAGIEPWREPGATAARINVLDQMNQGQALVTYNGHANPWQMAVTDIKFARPYLFNLIDVPDLDNAEKLFIQMSMTCYTSQFTRPGEFSHTTLDEALLLHPDGGAVGVWGPAGLSVAHGHDSLQTGFHKALRNKTPLTARLGELVSAGYFELVTNGSCCLDVAHTFLFSGDPLTVAGIQPLEKIYLPLVRRGGQN